MEESGQQGPDRVVPVSNSTSPVAGMCMCIHVLKIDCFSKVLIFIVFNLIV